MGRMVLVFWIGVSKRFVRPRRHVIRHGILALFAVFLLPACQTSSVDKDTFFDSNSKDAIVIAAARLRASAATNREVNTTNRSRLLYSIYWRKYDTQTDIATKDPSPEHFSIKLGTNSSSRKYCRLMDREWLYCIYDVEPGNYLLEAAVASQTTRVGGRLSSYTAFRTSLGVGKNFLGGLQINNDIPVSESESLRFEIESGKIYYLGGYTLSTYGQISNLQFDKARARRFLRNFDNINGEIQLANFEEPYKVELRKGACPGLFKIQSANFTYDNPCR